MTDVGVASNIPVTGPSGHFRVYVEGVPDPGSERVPRVPGKAISSDYFRLLKIPLVAGRAFTKVDGDETARVAVINEAFARCFFAIKIRSENGLVTLPAEYSVRSLE